MGGYDPLPFSLLGTPRFSLRLPERESDLGWDYLLATLLYKSLCLGVYDESCKIIG
jgi:hypothetical protein